MRVLAIVHEDHAGPGVFGEAIRERGDTLEEWMVPTVAEPPGDPLDYDAVLVLGDSNGHYREDRSTRFRKIAPALFACMALGAFAANAAQAAGWTIGTSGCRRPAPPSPRSP